MAPIDYSKWSKAAYDDEDEDDRPRKPRVTRLDGPSTITLGAREPPPAAGASANPHTTGAKAAAPKDRLDYSRWDNLECDDDDEDAEDVDDIEMASREAEGEEDDGEDALSESEQRGLAEIMRKSRAADNASSSTAAPAAAASSADSAETRHEALRAKLTRNGAERTEHLWRQSELEVELSILIPPGLKARDVRPEIVPADVSGTAAVAAGGMAGAAAAAAVGKTKQTVVVHERRPRGGSGAGSVLFSASLAYPVLQPDSEEDLVWEVTDFEAAERGGRRLVRLTLQKDSPRWVTVWWERAIVGEPPVDVAAFPDRSPAKAAAAQEQVGVWAEATRMFKEKVANRKPILIDAGGEAEEAEDQAAGGGDMCEIDG